MIGSKPQGQRKTTSTGGGYFESASFTLATLSPCVALAMCSSSWGQEGMSAKVSRQNGKCQVCKSFIPLTTFPEFRSLSQASSLLALRTGGLSCALALTKADVSLNARWAHTHTPARSCLYMPHSSLYTWAS